MAIRTSPFKLVQGQITKITDELWGTVLPLPFSPKHVNIWFLKQDDGWVVFDCGFNSPDTKKIWEEMIFKQVHPIVGVIISHFHLDHAGLAGWVAAKTDAQIYTTYREWFMMHFLTHEPKESYIARIKQHYLTAGMPEKEAKKLSDKAHIYPDLCTSLPSHFEVIESDQDFGDWYVSTVKGHAQDMVTLSHDEQKVFISCDHILPGVTPNISVLPLFDNSNPLSAYFQDLIPFKNMPDDYLVLPSHGQPFYGANAEVTRNILHHEKRFKKILKICESPQSAYHVTKELFKKKYDPSYFFYLLGETLSHLNYLVEEGCLDVVAENDINFFHLV